MKRKEIKCCEYCDRPFEANGHYGTARTKDHIVPRSILLGAPKDLNVEDIAAGRGNGAFACGRCNQLKGNMLPDQIRLLASLHRERAALLDQIADRAEAMIVERRLL